jgi:transposase, IS5 family
MEKQINKQINFFEPEMDSLVRKDHPYRKILELVDFAGLTRQLKFLLNRKYGRPGYNIESGFKGLILQFMEDLSDRELERYLQENVAGKLFCDFKLTEKTPDHSYFSELRRKIGVERLAKLFNKFGDKLKAKGLVTNIFTFVDASKMISKMSLWEERDKAIAAGEEKLNNQNIEKYSADKDADYGCKGNKDFWYGYKRHVAVCMRNGLITKTAVTKASITDAKGLKHVCPKEGMVIADKAYCVKPAQDIMRKNGCHSGAILKENMIGKNRDKDRFLTKLRMPYEGVFSRVNKKVRYRGLAKAQFQGFMQALAFNLKRLIKVGAPPLIFG